jgi:hypothetical protein
MLEGGRRPDVVDMLDIAAICSSEDAAASWAKSVGLLPSIVEQIPVCGRLTDDVVCGGTLYEVNIRGRPQIRCKRCHHYKSVRNGSQAIQGKGAGTWFSSFDTSGRPNTKLGYAKVLLLLFCWANRMSRSMTLYMGASLISPRSATVTNWFRHFRELCVDAQARAQPFGGPGRKVKVDESYMFPCWKSKRLAQDDQGPLAIENYGKRQLGPWILGLIYKHPNGHVEKRFFSILNRDAATLRAKILANVLPGTTIVTDEWRGYTGVATWVAPPLAPYIHRVLAVCRHCSQNIDDPLAVGSGGNRPRRIEVCWSDFHEQLIHLMRKTRRPSNLQGYCAAEWWHSMHVDQPFLDIVDEIRQQYPQ